MEAKGRRLIATFGERDGATLFLFVEAHSFAKNANEWGTRPLKN